MTVDISKPHSHVWTRTLDGCELANGLFDDDADAAYAFMGIATQIAKYNPEIQLTIEEAYNSIQGDNRGMYAGVPGFVVVVSRCEGGCKSPTWN